MAYQFSTLNKKKKKKSKRLGEVSDCHDLQYTPFPEPITVSRKNEVMFRSPYTCVLIVWLSLISDGYWNGFPTGNGLLFLWREKTRGLQTIEVLSISLEENFYNKKLFRISLFITAKILRHTKILNNERMANRWYVSVNIKFYTQIVIWT